MATYYIRFDTKDMAGRLVAWRVTLDKEVVRDLDRGLPINLCEDPLYPALVEYVRSNPPRHPSGNGDAKKEGGER